MKTITKHYIDGAFVESHGREVMDLLSPTTNQKIGSVVLADVEDTRKAAARLAQRRQPLGDLAADQIGMVLLDEMTTRPEGNGRAVL